MPTKTRAYADSNLHILNPLARALLPLPPSASSSREKLGRAGIVLGDASTRDFPSVKGNCIYFTHHNYDEANIFQKRDMLIWPLSMWFMPNLSKQGSGSPPGFITKGDGNLGVGRNRTMQGHLKKKIP